MKTLFKVIATLVFVLWFLANPAKASKAILIMWAISTDR